MICRNDPAAKRFRDGKTVSEKRDCDVDLVSTHVDVGKSHVFTEWSQDEE